jgi:hypothetical protein
MDICYVRFCILSTLGTPQALNDTSLVNNGRQTILAPADDRECFFIPLPCHLIEGYQPQQQSQPQPQQDYQEQSVLRIPDVYPGSEFFPSRIRIFPSRIAIKEFKYFNPKNGFQALGNMIRVAHPGSRIHILTFYPSRIPDPGSKGQKGTGSLIPDPDPQHWEQQSQEEDQIMGPTAFSLHYRIQKENATAARLRAGGDTEAADGGEGGFIEEFSFEVSDLLAEAENRRRAELNATRIVADIIRNISRILLVPRCGISRDTLIYYL